MEINRKQVVKEFLRNLYRISDKEYQKRIWIEGAGPECHDFDEAVNDFFGDGEPILANYQDYELTQSQYRILKKFYDEFRIFADDNDFPEEFIDTPEWDKIRAMAKDVLKAFQYNIPDEQLGLGDALFTIAQISTNKHRRRRAWIFAERSAQDDIEQSIQNFFIYFESISARRETLEITLGQYDLLVKFHTKLKAFTTEDDLDSETTRWAEIQQLGRTILQAFNYHQKQSP